MKILRAVIGAMTGAVLATLAAWGGLYLFGAAVLRGKGSLFDTNQHAANLFFVGWFVAMVAASLIGGWLGYSSGRR